MQIGRWNGRTRLANAGATWLICDPAGWIPNQTPLSCAVGGWMGRGGSGGGGGGGGVYLQWNVNIGIPLSHACLVTDVGKKKWSVFKRGSARDYKVLVFKEQGVFGIMMGLFKEQELQGAWLEDGEKEWFQCYTAGGNAWFPEKKLSFQKFWP